MKCGGWTVNPNMDAIKLSDNEDKAFKEVVAMMNDGLEYAPVLYVGWQLVSGLNHLFICKTKKRGVKEWTAVVKMRVYAPLSGPAELSDIEEIL